MSFERFENLIGKDISYANQILLVEGFQHKNLLEVNLYTSNSYKEFYRMSYNMVSIMTDENKIIKDITIHFHHIIDSSFYNSFTVDYGNPDAILVIDKDDSEGKFKEINPKKEFDHKLKKVTLKVVEGKFEDGPLFMIWKKDHYDIKILKKREQNISEITFRLPSNKL